MNRQFIFKNSATESTVVPVDSFSHAEYTSATEVSMYFNAKRGGKDATIKVVLTVTSGKAHDVISLITNHVASSSASVMRYDSVTDSYHAKNVTGITSVTITDSPSITTGPTGPQGPQGPQGETGAAGADGQDGQDGQNGQNGAAGSAGADGVDGQDGQDGQNGADGDGFTGGSYSGVTGIVTFTSDDGIGFSTGDLRGAAGADGSDGADGADGAAGADGADGQGVPTGGTTGQLLKKTSGTDYDTEWSSPPIIPLSNFSGRYTWTSTDDGERVLTGSTAYGPLNWYNFTNEPLTSWTTWLDYAGDEVAGTTTQSITGYYLFAFGVKNPFSGKKVRVDYSFRIYYSGTAPTTNTPFGLSLWTSDANATGSTSNVTLTYRGESDDHNMVAPQAGGTTAHHHGSFTTSSSIDDDYLLVCAEHRGTTGLNGTTYMPATISIYMVD